ncbi:hypothetical protein C8R44DRAFT_740022 [Mycena epipterygia]|nr:hypothetical protein C8R44DRAFT_740022 [Mycena epipterygia]
MPGRVQNMPLPYNYVHAKFQALLFDGKWAVRVKTSCLCYKRIFIVSAQVPELLGGDSMVSVRETLLLAELSSELWAAPSPFHFENYTASNAGDESGETGCKILSYNLLALEVEQGLLKIPSWLQILKFCTSQSTVLTQGCHRIDGIHSKEYPSALQSAAATQPRGRLELNMARLNPRLWD